MANFISLDKLSYFYTKLQNVFAEVSHTHTKSEITDFPTTMTPSSHAHGNITNAGDITTNVAIASGDRLVINDESASQLNNSSITFGSSTTTFLSNKGTWATPSKGSIAATKLWTNSSPTTSFAAQTIPLTLTDYFGVQVVFRWYTNQDYNIQVFIPKGIGSYYITNGQNGQFRKFNVTNSGVVVDAGTNSGDSLIPYQIWGLKLS